jgi:putative FmdB family regulatory protein
MPTYEYRCSKGHEFEQVQRMSEAPLDTCPQCGAPAERMLSVGGGLLFKGSGFYITDYRSDSYRKAAEADSGAGKAAKADTAPSKEGGGSSSASKKEGGSSSSKEGGSSAASSREGGGGSSAPKKEGGGGSSSASKAE